eukprot:1151936-Pelagomonas_calceolata.AAC.1
MTLHPFVANIQAKFEKRICCVFRKAAVRASMHAAKYMRVASWPKMGPEMAAQLMTSGCNDMGGSLMNESITKAAGGCACVYLCVCIITTSHHTSMSCLHPTSPRQQHHLSAHKHVVFAPSITKAA